MHARQVFNMQEGYIFSVIFLCFINISFMVAGIFLNSVVIISHGGRHNFERNHATLWLLYCLVLIWLKSRSLIHYWSYLPYIISKAKKKLMKYSRPQSPYILLYVVPRCLRSLRWMLNDSYLTCPFSHQASDTKTRLLCFHAFGTVIIVNRLLSLLFFIISRKIADMYATVIVLSLLFLFHLFKKYCISFKFIKEIQYFF
jgi:hypothetical protein